jgi:hypothetical protein
MQLIGYGLTGLVTLFLLMDAVMKIVSAKPAVAATVALGFRAGQIPVLGAILFIATAFYVFPRTALLGAVLVTAYLGGAIAIHYRQGSPLFSHILFGVYVGLMVWGGFWLRSAELRNLLPWVRPY